MLRRCGSALRNSSVPTAARSYSSQRMQAAVHNPSKQRFEINFADINEPAVLEYAEIRAGVYDLYHTGVPPAKQGMGLGGKLADATMGWIMNNNYKAKLSCSYLRDTWLPRHPEAAPFVVPK